jgi:hypothetical protein
LFVGAKTFMKVAIKGDALFYLCSSLIKCWATFTWNSFLILIIQECVWEEEFEHLAQALTIWLHH